MKTDEFATILAALILALRERHSVSLPMQRLLVATGSRAVGLWACRGNELVSLGFEAVEDMPAYVRTGFVQATARVPFDQSGLGIVKAAVTRQPAVATLSEQQAGLSGSAGWLSRFGAVQSLAMPVIHDGEVVGVLAISTPNVVAQNDAVWQLVEQLADALAPILVGGRA